MEYHSNLMIERRNDSQPDAIADAVGVDYYELAAIDFTLIPILDKNDAQVAYRIVFSTTTAYNFVKISLCGSVSPSC